MKQNKNPSYAAWIGTGMIALASLGFGIAECKGKLGLDGLIRLAAEEVSKYAPEKLLARTIYGEARGEVDSNNLDYIHGCMKSIQTRAKLKGKPIKEILLAKRTIRRKDGTEETIYQYTCLDPKDKNYKEVCNPANKKTFNSCEEISKKLLEKNDFPEVTNYYVGKPALEKTYRKLTEIRKDNIPSWAFEMKNEKFIRDDQGYFIPRKPVITTPVHQTRKNPEIKAYFYYFKYF